MNEIGLDQCNFINKISQQLANKVKDSDLEKINN